MLIIQDFLTFSHQISGQTSSLQTVALRKQTKGDNLLMLPARQIYLSMLNWLSLELYVILKKTPWGDRCR